MIVYYLMNFVAIILGVVALKTMLITRIEMYFSIFAIVYIPEILSKFKEKEIINIFFMVMMFIPMLVQLVNNNNGILPYENWLFQILLK